MAWPPLAGQIIRATDFGLLPGQRVATMEITEDIGSISDTTQTELTSVTAPLRAGATYRVRVAVRIGSSAGGVTELGVLRLYAGAMGAEGAEIASANVCVLSSSNLGWPVTFEVEWVAASTASQTFTLAVTRSGSASGTWRLEAAANRPSYLTVDYIRG